LSRKNFSQRSKEFFIEKFLASWKPEVSPAAINQLFIPAIMLLGLHDCGIGIKVIWETFNGYFLQSHSGITFFKVANLYDFIKIYLIYFDPFRKPL
jgi:hypothetical protein